MLRARRKLAAYNQGPEDAEAGIGGESGQSKEPPMMEHVGSRVMTSPVCTLPDITCLYHLHLTELAVLYLIFLYV